MTDILSANPSPHYALWRLCSHYPVFHQMEGVHLFGEGDLHRMGLGVGEGILENGEQTLEKQARHTAGAARLLEVHLKKSMSRCLIPFRPFSRNCVPCFVVWLPSVCCVVASDTFLSVFVLVETYQ